MLKISAKIMQLRETTKKNLYFLLRKVEKRLSTFSTARSASQLREALLNLFLNKKYRNFLVVSRSCIIFAEIFDIDRNLNIYHYDRRKTDTGWR